MMLDTLCQDQLKLAVRKAIINKGSLVREDANEFGWIDYEGTDRDSRLRAVLHVTADDPIDDAEWSEFVGTDTDGIDHYGIEVTVRIGGYDRTWRYEGSMGALLTEILR